MRAAESGWRQTELRRGGVRSISGSAGRSRRRSPRSYPAAIGAAAAGRRDDTGTVIAPPPAHRRRMQCGRAAARGRCRRSRRSPRPDSTHPPARLARLRGASSSGGTDGQRTKTDAAAGPRSPRCENDRAVARAPRPERREDVPPLVLRPPLRGSPKLSASRAARRGTGTGTTPRLRAQEQSLRPLSAASEASRRRAPRRRQGEDGSRCACETAGLYSPRSALQQVGERNAHRRDRLAASSAPGLAACRRRPRPRGGRAGDAAEPQRVAAALPRGSARPLFARWGPPGERPEQGALGPEHVWSDSKRRLLRITLARQGDVEMRCRARRALDGDGRGPG